MSVTVDNGSEALRVTMKHKRVLHEDVVWIDTRAGDPGPEYRVGFLANSDGLSFRRVELFKTGEGKPWACSNAEAHSNNSAPGARSWINIPQGCLSSWLVVLAELTFNTPERLKPPSNRDRKPLPI